MYQIYISQVSNLVDIVHAEANRLCEKPDWWMIFAGGCTRDQGGLPYHISKDEEIEQATTILLKLFLKYLPKPILITIARSTEDGYCPPHQVSYLFIFC